MVAAPAASSVKTRLVRVYQRRRMAVEDPVRSRIGRACRYWLMAIFGDCLGCGGGSPRGRSGWSGEDESIDRHTGRGRTTRRTRRSSLRASVSISPPSIRRTARFGRRSKASGCRPLQNEHLDRQMEGVERSPPPRADPPACSTRGRAAAISLRGIRRATMNRATIRCRRSWPRAWSARPSSGDPSASLGRQCEDHRA